MNSGLEPLVETHNAGEIELALATKTQMIGINNPDLSTMTIDRSTTRNLSERLRSAGPAGDLGERDAFSRRYP